MVDLHPDVTPTATPCPYTTLVRPLVRRPTGTTTTDALATCGTATGLGGQVAAPPAQPLLHVLQLGQLDLGLARLRLRVLGEDVEDQRGPVDCLDLELVLEVPQLARREVPVEHDGVGEIGRAQV